MRKVFGVENAARELGFVDPDRVDCSPFEEDRRRQDEALGTGARVGARPCEARRGAGEKGEQSRRRFDSSLHTWRSLATSEHKRGVVATTLRPHVERRRLAEGV